MGPPEFVGAVHKILLGTLPGQDFTSKLGEVYNRSKTGFNQGIHTILAGQGVLHRRLIHRGEERIYTMGQKRDAPTAEEVAEAAGGDVETARRALSVVRIRDETPE